MRTKKEIEEKFEQVKREYKELVDNAKDENAYTNAKGIAAAAILKILVWVLEPKKRGQDVNNNE